MSDTSHMTMARAWAHYESICVPAQAGPGQRRDVEAAFMAGAWVAFSYMEAAADHPNEEQAARWLERCRHECHDFIKKMGKPPDAIN